MNSYPIKHGLFVNKRSLYLIATVGVLSAPSQMISLLGVLFFILFVMKDLSFGERKFSIYIFISVSVISLVFHSFYTGVSQFVKSFVFFLFISPFLVYSFSVNRRGEYFSEDFIKRFIEVYFIIQALFCFLSILITVAAGRFTGFDTDFGDVVAGSFRNPLVLTQDTANKSFSFLTILLLYYYISQFRQSVNVVLVLVMVGLVFLASVTHLTLFAVLALCISKFKLNKYFLFAVLSAFLTLFLYKYLQPVNFRLINERLELVLSTLGNLENLYLIGDKGEYLYNFIITSKDEFFRLLTVGFGHGNYSSRASILLVGGFGSSGILDVSKEMMSNTYPLLQEFLTKPLWQRGAFYFPYNDFVSLLAELGGVCFFILLFSFARRLIGMFSNRDAVFYFSFIILASLVDHYIEYFAPLAVFFILIISRKKCEKFG